MSSASDFTPGDPSLVNKLLLTIDIVDQMRHRESQLAELSDNTQQREALRERVIATYRSQGIEVSERMIDEALLAQRERRFEHVPKPITLPAIPLFLWIRRGLVARAFIAACLGLVVFAVVHHFGVVAPRERAQIKRITFAALLQQQILDSHTQISDRLAAASAALETAIGQVANAPERARVEPAAERLKAVASSNLADALRLTASSILGPMPSPLTPENVASVGLATETELNKRAESLKTAGIHLVSAESAINTISGLASASVALESASIAVDKKPLNASRIQERGSVYANGDLALREGDPVAAMAAANRLNAIGQDLAVLQNLRDNAVQFMQMGLSTNPVPDALSALNEANIAFLASADSGDQQASREALVNLQAIVEQLQENLTYRIVARPGESSVLSKHPFGAPNAAKLYFALVEAVDPQGKVVPLWIRDDELGTVTQVAKFGLRVSQSVFDAIVADKSDNIIDNPLVGQKPRGALTPTFSVEVVGGYTTRLSNK